MIPEEQFRKQSASKPYVIARRERLLLVTRVLGAESNESRARLLGVSARTIYNALEGLPVGDRVIAHTLALMAARREELEPLNIHAKFDEVFQVVSDGATAA